MPGLLSWHSFCSIEVLWGFKPKLPVRINMKRDTACMWYRPNCSNWRARCDVERQSEEPLSWRRTNMRRRSNDRKSRWAIWRVSSKDSWKEVRTSAAKTRWCTNAATFYCFSLLYFTPHAREHWRLSTRHVMVFVLSGQTAKQHFLQCQNNTGTQRY